MDELERTYWIAFARIRGIGRVRIQQLEDHFGSLAQAWAATAGELKAAGIDDAALRAIVGARPDIDPEAEAGALARSGVRAVTWHDDEYPKALLEISDRPAVLFVRGQLLRSDEWAVAVVGTRHQVCGG